MHEWMRASLEPERLDGLYSYWAFKSLSTLGRCPGNLGIPTPKTAAPSMRSETEVGNFLENGYNDFGNISVIYAGHLAK
jgi:hypothetical protein